MRSTIGVNGSDEGVFEQMVRWLKHILARLADCNI